MPSRSHAGAGAHAAGRAGQRILGVQVMAPAALRAFNSEAGPFPIIVSVARAGPRGEVRAALDGLGFVELRDYVCAT